MTFNFDDWVAEKNLRVANKNLRNPAYCWVDVETTGLDIFTDDILEIGVVITNEFGELIPDSFMSTLTIPWHMEIPDMVNKFYKNKIIVDMHRKSGLYQEYEDAGRIPSYERADNLLLQHVKKFAPANSMTWAGGNVGSFDKPMTMRMLPGFGDYLFYRCVDSSSLKEMARRLNEPIFQHWQNQQPEKGHRPQHCIADSINEYVYYLNEFCMPDWSRYGEVE